MMTMAGGLVVKQSGIFLLKTVIPRLKEEGMKEIKKLWEVSDPDSIRNLEESLKSVEDLLKVPTDFYEQEKKTEVEEYKEIFLKLQHLAYDLEDILDALPAAAAAAADDGCAYACGPDIPCLQPFYHLVNRILAFGSHAVQCFSCDCSENLPSRIQTMMLSLETNHVEGEMDNFHQLEVKLKEEAIPLRENTSLGDKRIVGREEETKKIIQMLVKEGSSDENYEVISIVGKGGLGKTTFAQYVYNHVQVNDHFKELKAWVSMPETEHLDLTHVMTNVINSAMKNKLTFGDLNLTQDKLLEVVKDKRFLIVLDDVWTKNPDHWEILKRPLQHGAKGSKVIVTTRLEEVANIMSQNSIHNIIHLKDFSDDECWVLFKRNARLGSDVDLSEMQSEIIRRCNGLPLAAKALGRLFSKYQDESQRRGILNNSIWSEEGKALPVLRLSYFHLPLYLKPIFAYFALFPKGYIFNKMDIILLWMAQGMLLPKNKEERMEGIGRSYFDQLVSSSLVERSLSNQKCYVMHDLVHDLSVWAAGEICLHLMVNHGVTQKKEQLTRTRHLNLCTNDDIDELDQLPCTRQLRTFIDLPYGSFYDKQKLRAFILSLRSIRTLFLASSTIEELPECIGDLKFLRLLDLKFKKITSLPESIGKLHNLQVLFLTGCDNLTEGLDFGLLKNLRHVRFPRSLWKAMPLGISKLTDLQTLGDMYLGDEHGKGSMIRELKSLNHLHEELTIIGMHNVKGVEDAQEMHLDEKSSLKKLCLEYWAGSGEYENLVLEQLKPNSCIKEYELVGYNGLALPSWLGDPAFKNMVEIKLVRCYRCKQLPPLGQLPSLKKLWVEEMRSLCGFLDFFIEKFRCLEELVIKKCESFQGTLQPLPSCLKVLMIEYCYQAKVSIPSASKLEVLKVVNCDALLLSRDMLFIHCFEKICLENIKSGFTGLWVDGPCRQGLFLENCVSLVSIEKIPVAAEKVHIEKCGKLKRVEWEGVSASSTSNNNGVVSIEIDRCKSVVRVGNIPLVATKLDIKFCESLEEVKFGGKWNSVEYSEATDGEDNNGPPQLKLAQLVELNIQRCPKLRLLAEGVVMPSLQQLHIVGSPKLYDSTIHRLPSTTLRDLIIEGFSNLKTIKFSTFPNLTTLSIGKCSQDFAFFRDGVDQLQVSPIQDLTIKLMEAKKPIQEWGLDLLTHLQHLTLSCISWGGDGVIECIVGKDYSHTTTSSPSCSTLYLPSFSLKQLTIFCVKSEQIWSSFNDLKSIDCSTFPNLALLDSSFCPKLESLGPNNYLPPKLQHVFISGSPLLKQQCTPDTYGVIRFAYDDDQYTISNERKDDLN